MMARLVYLCMLLLAHQAKSQIESAPMMLSMEPVTGVDFPPHVVAYYRAEVNFEQLRLVPYTMEVQLPGFPAVVADVTRFRGRDGYDEANLEFPPITLTPGAEIEDMEYFWSGDGPNGVQVVLSVFGTRAYASIWAHNEKFILEPSSEPGISHIFQLDPSGIRPGPSPPQPVNANSFWSLLLLVLTVWLVSFRQQQQTGDQQGSQ